eukprot:11277231-Alexandrium_andersonii.AAC.1
MAGDGPRASRQPGCGAGNCRPPSFAPAGLRRARTGYRMNSSTAVPSSWCSCWARLSTPQPSERM